jgi:hypothetical protein
LCKLSKKLPTSFDWPIHKQLKIVFPSRPAPDSPVIVEALKTLELRGQVKYVEPFGQIRKLAVALRPVEQTYGIAPSDVVRVIKFVRIGAATVRRGACRY